ncbi:MAG: BatA and WFA domain-containing protein [Polyangiaceae bacterium]|nr:BatA and WFA domain-containing protein [Polyangiaceae bacterium]
MTFLTYFALGVALFVVAPYLAHRLRRRHAEERPFAPAHLVPSARPRARRRAKLEDRTLFLIRAASIIALALLGASPLVRCTRLAMSRSGTSVAIAFVLDDSMSMRATDPVTSRTKFRRAREGAREILASLREGDAAAIVLAGAPARVALGATTDISSARAALEAMHETDRATDLDGALAIAKTLVADLPQIDRRIIVLSDLTDGKPDAPPLGEASDVAVWMAMPELREPAAAGDCGLLSADRSGASIRVRFACTEASVAKDREIEIKDGDKVIASAKLPETTVGEAVAIVPGNDAREFVAALTGTDAIASDDLAPVLAETGPAAIAVVGNRTDQAVATGGVPAVEQALAALHLDMTVRPIPQAPDRKEDTAAFAAIIVDDPPGFTPEERHVLAAFVERGGMLLLALGPHAAAAPLGANFEPLLSRAVEWSSASTKGAVATASPIFGEAAASLEDLAPAGRAKLADEDASAYETVLAWSDGSPLVARRMRGRGEVWMTTLPFSLDTSDFALRPGFLALLDAFVSDARTHSAKRRSDVAVPWTFPGARQLEAIGPVGPVTPRNEGGLRIVPELAGAYALTVDGAKELRVAAPIAREIDFRPRAVTSKATSSSLGGGVAVVDVSWIVALVLLALLASEIVLRALTRPRGQVA